MLRHEVLLASVLALAACGSGGDGGSATLPTSPSSATISATVAPSSQVTESGDDTLSSDSVPAATMVPATTVPGSIGLTPGGPWTLVDSAPGITTPGLVYELMPKLWVYLPVEEDIAHGITWTFTEADRAIIEAYLQARLVYFQAVTSDPMDLEAPGWQTWYADGGEQFLDVLRPRSDLGQSVDLASGVVLRPVVVGDGRTADEAVVFDCALDGGVFRSPDGSLAEGSIEGVVPTGLGFRMERIGESWKAGRYGSQPEACL